jgi:hypothetical protein
MNEGRLMNAKISMPLALIMFGAMTTTSAAGMPTQKPGLWQMTVKSEQMPGGSRSFEMCEDAAFIAAGKASADAHIKNNCSATSSVRKVGDTWISDSDCKLSGIHIVSHSETTVHGDALFHTEATSTIDLPDGGKKSDSMTMDNKWLGPCKPGQKPGVPVTGQ